MSSRLKNSSGKSFAFGLSGFRNQFRTYVRSVFKRVFHQLLDGLGIRRLREHSFFATLLARPAAIADFGAHRGEFFAAFAAEYRDSRALLIEADLARQRRKSRPVFAVLIPSLIGRENHLAEEDRRKFEPLRHRLTATERAELDELFARPMKPHVYAQIKLLLDRCFHRRVIQEGEKDELERTIAKCTSVQGANCALVRMDITTKRVPRPSSAWAGKFMAEVSAKFDRSSAPPASVSLPRA